MTQINDIADLVRVQQENPEWLYTLQGMIISRDFAEVPSRLNRMEAILEGNQELLQSNQELLARLVTANDNATARMDRMEQDRSTLKNLTTRIQGDKYAPALAADLHLTFNRCLPP